MNSQVKTLPHSKESEMMVLGCMLTGLDNLKLASEELDDSDFYFIENKIIFQVLKSAYKQDKPADIHLICEELKRLDKLKTAGGAPYITTLAQYAGTSAYIEEYVEQLKSKTLLRAMISTSQEVEKDAFGEPANPTLLVEKLQNNLKILEQRHGKKIPIMSSEEHLENQKQFLAQHRGKEFIGLRTSKIPEFNRNLSGLRGLKLLAAAPNVGKTALTIQLGIDVLENEEEACLIYVSLEMSSLTIFNRITFYLAGMDFSTFVLGSQKIQGTDGEAFFTKEELKKIEEAEKKVKLFGERLQIIDSEMCPYIDSRMIINYVEAVKLKTKCKRAIVIIDYLQEWTTPQNMAENEADKWRIREMKKIRDAMNDDPVIVISEARKPPEGAKEWGSDLSDVMGSAKGTYTPDVVMLLTTATDKQLEKLWENLPQIPNPINSNESECTNNNSKIRDFLAGYGIAICNLKVAKCRDGMRKFNTVLTFHFNKNKFVKFDKDYFLGLGMDEKNKKQNNIKKVDFS